jgi:hypothetical protein
MRIVALRDGHGVAHREIASGFNDAAVRGLRLIRLRVLLLATFSLRFSAGPSFFDRAAGGVPRGEVDRFDAALLEQLCVVQMAGEDQ